MGPTGPTGPAGTTGIPVGGAAGTFLKKNSATNYDTAWGLPSGLFRGVWADAAAVATYDFTSGIPAAFTTFNTGSGSVPNTGAVSGAAGAASLPSGVTIAARCLAGNIGAAGGHSSGIRLNLATLGIGNILKVSFWEGAGQSGNSNGYESRFTAGGVTRMSRVLLGGGVTTNPWGYREYGIYGVSSPENAPTYYTRIVLYASADPYMAGQYVLHNGQMYVSTIDTNPNVPSTLTGWAVVPIGPGGSVVLDAIQTVAQYETANGVKVPPGTLVARKV